MGRAATHQVQSKTRCSWCSTTFIFWSSNPS